MPPTHDRRRVGYPSPTSETITLILGNPVNNSEENRVKNTRSKKGRGLVTRSIVYKSNKHPHERHRELKVNVPRGETIDARYAAALVVVRTGASLADVDIVKITGVDE